MDAVAVAVVNTTLSLGGGLVTVIVDGGRAQARAMHDALVQAMARRTALDDAATGPVTVCQHDFSLHVQCGPAAWDITRVVVRFRATGKGSVGLRLAGGGDEGTVDAHVAIGLTDALFIEQSCADFEALVQIAGRVLASVAVFAPHDGPLGGDFVSLHGDSLAASASERHPQ